MADVSIRGVTYTGVAKLDLDKSGGGSAIYYDTEDADAVAADILTGKKAYGTSGLITGTRQPPSGSISITDNGSVDVTDYATALVNVQGGGGGPTASDAILTVTAPAGSTVTATKGSTTLVPTLWTTADGNQECALFVIEPEQFDSSTPWTVTATLGAETVTDTVTIDSNKQYNLKLAFHVPAEYQEVEWLESTGTQYIITGIAPSEVRGGAFSFVKTADVSYSFLWGAGSNSTAVANALGFRISKGGSQQTGLCYGGNGPALSATVNTNTEYDVAFSCSPGAQELEINGITSSASYSENPTSAYPIALFSFRYDGTVKQAENCKARLKHIEFYNVVNAKIYDAYPCYRKSDSVAGMWDRVSKTFQTNSGSGTFVVGSDV